MSDVPVVSVERLPKFWAAGRPAAGHLFGRSVIRLPFPEKVALDALGHIRYIKDAGRLRNHLESVNS